MEFANRRLGWFGQFNLLQQVILTTLTTLSLFCFSVECRSKNNIGIKTPRISGGANAELNEFPFQVYFFSTQPFCGGTILNENYVLTAAHCFWHINESMSESFSNLTIVAGDLNWRSVDGNEQIRRIQKIFKHENYNASSLANNIAIVKVTPPLIFNAAVQPAQLLVANSALPEENVTATGWGYLWERKSNLFSRFQPSILQKVELPIVSYAECAEAYEMVWGVADNMICTGNLRVGVRGSCVGDAGGPLSIKAKDNTYAVVGIGSFGDNCGLAKYPDVYTKIANYVNWITAVAGPSTTQIIRH